MDSKRCTILAPAKINLGLNVLFKRPDGFHELETFLVALDLYDKLTFWRTETGGIRLSVEFQNPEFEADTDFPLDDRNLIVRAVHAVEQVTGVCAHLQISLEKKIPVAAGLGGGSSDAAAAIMATNHLFGLELGADRLAEIGGQIGSDVPFFLNGPAAAATGRGEQIQPHDVYSDWWAVLISPHAHLSTREVYGQLDLTSSKPTTSFVACGDEEGFFAALRQCCNNLEIVAIRRVPELLEFKKQLREVGAEEVFVTGSGPTVVGVFRERPSEEAIRAVRSQHDLVRVLTAQPVRTSTALMVQ